MLVRAHRAARHCRQLDLRAEWPDLATHLQGLDLLGQYQHVAIFDADFKPEPDFLVRPAACAPCAPCQVYSLHCSLSAGQNLRHTLTSTCTRLTHCAIQLHTVPYLIDNPEVGYVQTRWVFANPEESYLTKVR